MGAPSSPPVVIAMARRGGGSVALWLTLVALLGCSALLVLLTACGLGSRELRMHLQTHRHFEPQLIESIMAEQSRLRIVAAEQVPGRSALEALQDLLGGRVEQENVVRAETAGGQAVRSGHPLHAQPAPATLVGIGCFRETIA